MQTVPIMRRQNMPPPIFGLTAVRMR
jgi:hypothetical protein